VRTVYWRKAGPDLPLLLVVIKPLGYNLRQGSKLLYQRWGPPQEFSSVAKKSDRVGLA
jgi:hypothetical protein